MNFDPDSPESIALLEFASSSDNGRNLICSMANLYATDKEMYAMFKQGLNIFETMMYFIQHGYIDARYSELCESIRNAMVPQKCPSLLDDIAASIEQLRNAAK